LTHWRYASATDTGLVRETNQDAIYVDDTLAVVADGMGGHAAGEVASALTIDLVCRNFGERPTWEGLFRAIEAANRAIIADARDNPERFGMGTTVIAVGLTRDAAGVVSPTLFNVGDSRAYQLRDGALRQLSEDHSVAEEWVRMGRLTSEEAQVHPRRHQLTRALGVEDELQVDVSSIDAEAGDRILLCSDGLSNELSGEELVRLASPPMPLEDSVSQLIDAARQAGGRDNISAILLEFDDVTVATAPIKKTMKSRVPGPTRASRPPAGADDSPGGCGSVSPCSFSSWAAASSWCTGTRTRPTTSATTPEPSRSTRASRAAFSGTSRSRCSTRPTRRRSFDRPTARS
jgi:protein phosphatase